MAAIRRNPLIIILGLVALIVAAWLFMLRGPDRHSYSLLFENGGQLVTGGEVRVAGRQVGVVRGISLTDDNLARVEVAVDEPYSPLPQGTTATIRMTSMSGQANRYIALALGRNDAPKLKPGATIALDATTTAVDLDELFATFDRPTRQALRDTIAGFSAQYDKGGGERANKALRYFSPQLTSLTALNEEIGRDRRALEQVLLNGAQMSRALLARPGELGRAVKQAGTAMEAIGARSDELEKALAELPATLRQANTTFAQTRAALDDLDRLTDVSRPVAPKFAQLLRRLRPLVNDAVPTTRSLRQLLSSPGANNDLVDLLERQPRLTQVATPALRNSTRALRRGTPVLQFARPYTPDLIGWFRDFGQTTANYDANGHYARVSPVVDAFDAAISGSTLTLTSKAPSARRLDLQNGSGRRCPGAATAPLADGSNPYIPTGVDCDPAIQVPGP